VRGAQGQRCADALVGEGRRQADVEDAQFGGRVAHCACDAIGVGQSRDDLVPGITGA
jgi:hypothetical protein